jgi:hypothetical protein
MVKDPGQNIPKRILLCGRRLRQRQQAQSLIEVAIFLPLLTLLCCYAVDFAYFFIVSASLSSSARNAVVYSIQGTSSPAPSALPAAGPLTDTKSVAGVALAELSGLARSATVTAVQVCSPKIGTSSEGAPLCQSYGATSLSYTPDTDPEPTLFQLNRVDVVYTIQPPVPLTFFSVSLLPSLNFHRMAEMRVMN